jgi:hypothetical protein
VTRDSRIDRNYTVYHFQRLTRMLNVRLHCLGLSQLIVISLAPSLKLLVLSVLTSATWFCN